MPMPHAIMKHWHPMLGVDLHIPWPPGSPSPAPSPVPYRTASLLIGTTGAKASYAKTHLSHGMGMTMQQGTDIGYLIPHVGPPSVLLAIEIPLSTSVSYFGTSMLLVEGKPACVALAGLVNPNLNCGTPLPTPTGGVLALNTHFAAMTLGDLLGGITQMAMDAAVAFLLGKAFGALGKGLGARFGPRLAKWLGPRAYNRTLLRTIMNSGDSRVIGMNVAEFEAEAAQALIESQAKAIVDNAFGAIVGTPTGMVIDAGRQALGSDPDAKLVREGYSAMGDYLETGGVEEHPATTYGNPDDDWGPSMTE
ncbi:MAG: hypothetical protein L0H83_06000 [Salinisphaera sp.]|nr:hypothetical protein [Salinisphaera sp.]